MTADIDFVQVDGIDIAYRFDGPLGAPVIVLVTGFGDQLVDWPSSLIEGLNAAGYRILRFEPRDSGLSGLDQSWKSHGKMGLIAAAMGFGPRPDYTLDDLAGELLGLLDALKIDRPHVIGYSMGGMIVQRAAIKRQFASLALLFSSSQAPGLSRGVFRASQASMNLAQRKGKHEDRVAAGLAMVAVTNGPIFSKSPCEARSDVEHQLARAYNPEGIGRMMLALLKSPPAYDRLSEIAAPTLVFSAEQDCFFGPDHARDLVNRIPDADLRIIEGSGHNLPDALGQLIAIKWIEKFGRAV